MREAAMNNANSFLVGAQSSHSTEPISSSSRMPVRRTEIDPLLTAEEVAKRLNVSTDWVWDHSSRKKPYLPVIRMGDGTLRYRFSAIEAFIDERERLSSMHRRAG
jgi:predicted DNA-binding transcriptional regulator AlpA